VFGREINQLTLASERLADGRLRSHFEFPHPMVPSVAIVFSWRRKKASAGTAEAPAVTVDQSPSQ
jgi:hypothetical protein